MTTATTKRTAAKKTTASKPAAAKKTATVAELKVTGNKKIGTLQKESDTVFGLYGQVCYTSAEGKGYYTSGVSDTKTLSAFNAECEKAGCKKGVYR